jgi:hypothetical protein
VRNPGTSVPFTGVWGGRPMLLKWLSLPPVGRVDCSLAHRTAKLDTTRRCCPTGESGNSQHSSQPPPTGNKTSFQTA